jgi:hypothetical protein
VRLAEPGRGLAGELLEKPVVISLEVIPMVGPNLAPAPGGQFDAAASSSMTLRTTENQAETKPKADFSKLLTVTQLVVVLNATICRHNFQWGKCTRGCCIHRRVKKCCKECGGSQVCPHGRRKSSCKQPDCAAAKVAMKAAKAAKKAARG